MDLAGGALFFYGCPNIQSPLVSPFYLPLGFPPGSKGKGLLIGLFNTVFLAHFV